MRNLGFTLVLCCAVGCGEDEAPALQVRSIEEPCSISIPGESLRCGSLEVPENYARPNGRRVRLPYVVLQATGPAKVADPIVYLTGGPGASGIGFASVVARQDRARETRDIIVIEQRGNGVADPALVCETDDLRTCYDGFVEAGVDLAQYTTSVAARDVAEFRRALGIAEWNLYGISYGTTLALHVLKSHPEGVRTAVLDSPTATTVDIAQADVESQLDALTTLFEACAADAACNSAHPNARARFLEMVEGLDREPLNLEGDIADQFGTPVLNGAALVRSTVGGLQAGPRLVSSMLAIHAAIAARELEALPALIGDVSGPVPEGFPPERMTAVGLTLSVYCAELADSRFGTVPFATREVWPDSVVQALTPDYLVQCREGLWPVAPIVDADREIVRSDVPTLLLAGEFDPVTPLRQAQIAAEGLTRATVIEVPGATHAVTEHSPCARAIMRDFLDAPSDTDIACLATVPPLTFVE